MKRKHYYIRNGPPEYFSGMPRKIRMLRGYFKLRPDDIIEKGDLFAGRVWMDCEGMEGQTVGYAVYIRKGTRASNPPKTRPGSKARIAARLPRELV